MGSEDKRALPAGKSIQRHPRKMLWIKGGPSEDREERREEVREHCSRCYDAGEGRREGRTPQRFSRKG